MAKCYVKDCSENANQTILGTDVKFCPHHGNEYRNALVDMRANYPMHRIGPAGHINWKYVLDNVSFTNPKPVVLAANAGANEAPAGAPKEFN
jgi:hypothetical protein